MNLEEGDGSIGFPERDPTREGDGFVGGGSPLPQFPPWPGPGFCFSSWLGDQARLIPLLDRLSETRRGKSIGHMTKKKQHDMKLDPLKQKQLIDSRGDAAQFKKKIWLSCPECSRSASSNNIAVVSCVQCCT